MLVPYVQIGSVGYEDGEYSFGGWNNRRRYARLSVTETTIKIRLFPFFWLRHYTFATVAVSQLYTCHVGTYIGRYYDGLGIMRTVAEYPRSVSFWSPDLEALIAALQRRGYQVKRSKPAPTTASDA